MELRHRGELAEFSGEHHEWEIPPAKGKGHRAANSIAVKENPFFFYGWIILSRSTGIQERGDEDRNKQGI